MKQKNDHDRPRNSRFRGISMHKLLDQTVPGEPMENHCTPGRKGENPTEEDMAEIKRITDELCAGTCEIDYAMS